MNRQAAADPSGLVAASVHAAAAGNAGTAPAEVASVWRTVWRLRSLAWAEWRAHPWRQAAALLAVALGVALAFSVHLINESALAEFGAAVRSANGQPDVSLVATGAAGVEEHWLDALLAHPAVREASPRVTADTVLLLPGRERPAVRLLGLDALSVAAVAPELLPQPEGGADRVAPERSPGAAASGAVPDGPAPTPLDAGGPQPPDPRVAVLAPGVVHVNAALAALLAPSAGADPAGASLRVLLAGQPVALPVAGTVAAGGAPLAVLDIASAQALFGTPGWVSRIDLRLQPGATAASLLSGADALKLPATLRLDTPADAGQRVSNLSRAYRVNLTVLALVALVVGAFMVFSVVSLSVAQRQPQLALLGVLGLSAGQRQALVLAECAVLGAVASVLGLALGLGMAAGALQWLAGDLGGGYFAGGVPALQLSAPAALVFAALGLLAAMAGGAWPARQAAGLSPAQALKGLGQVGVTAPPAWPGTSLLAASAGLALLPPVAGLPLAAYASVAAALVGGIALVPWVVQGLLGSRGLAPARRPLWLLGLQRARYFRGTATAAVAGVVASLALCVALTVMVASFRSAVDHWLDGVLPADLYLRTSAPGQGGEQVYFPTGWAEGAAAQVPGVARVLPGRGRALSLRANQPEVWLQARPLGADPAQALPLLSPPLPLAEGEVGVFVSEAVQALHGAHPGQVLALPLRPGAAPAPLRVRGIWRDYARQVGSVMMDLDDYRRLSGDLQVNDLAVWLAPGAALAEVEARLRASARAAGADEPSLTSASTAQIRALSLQIFDRSFAVTRYLQAVAIAIGLAGVAASLSAQVLARRREFGLLAHLGLTRRQVLLLVVIESACWLLAGLAVGVALGLAISAVLVHVVNPQSFHWTMPLQVPPGAVAALAGSVLAAGVLTSALAAGVLTSALAARHATGGDAVRAVREDW